jgi:hypothetical protein
MVGGEPKMNDESTGRQEPANFQRPNEWEE